VYSGGQKGNPSDPQKRSAIQIISTFSASKCRRRRELDEALLKNPFYFQYGRFGSLRAFGGIANAKRLGEHTVAFTINTNITSLQAQSYLNKSSMFQSQTINEVTSGLRIVNSGDDAAGLSIANGLRSDQAVLTQGIRNANDGLSVLQTIDGGMNNISNLLDRASTLATQSASSTFTGDRTVVNNEFQSVLSEINRQAQAIGLNQGGEFAKALSVFIGGGTTSGNITAIQNGSIGVDLTHSTIDTQSLGLSGYSVTGADGVDIGPGAGTTSVENILANLSNQGSEKQAGYTTLYFTGPGFANTTGNNRVAVSVNLSGVNDANSLATAINGRFRARGTPTARKRRRSRMQASPPPSTPMAAMAPMQRPTCSSPVPIRHSRWRRATKCPTLYWATSRPARKASRSTPRRPPPT